MRTPRRRLIWIGAAAAACGIAARASPAATTDPEVRSPCTISGYLKAADPQGVDVRGAPRADAPVIGRLPPPASPATGVTELFGAEFNILGVKNGWLLISEAEVEFDDTIKMVFKGPGWIPDDKADFVIGSQELRAAPANNAAVTSKLTGDLKDGSGYGPVPCLAGTRLHKGHFVEITIAPPRGLAGPPLRGWANKVCSNQKTTCDPAVVDPNRGDGP